MSKKERGLCEPSRESFQRQGETRVNFNIHVRRAIRAAENQGVICSLQGFPGGSVVKSPPASAGEAGLIPGSRRFPGGGNGNPLQYSCLGNPMDRRVWWATVRGVTKESDTTWQLSHQLLATECPQSRNGDTNEAAKREG